MNDQQRIERATFVRGRMRGPMERCRCPEHPRKWIVFQWVWSVPDEGETDLDMLQGGDGFTDVVRPCTECAKEDA